MTRKQLHTDCFMGRGLQAVSVRLHPLPSLYCDACLTAAQLRRHFLPLSGPEQSCRTELSFRSVPLKPVIFSPGFRSRCRPTRCVSRSCAPATRTAAWKRTTSWGNNEGKKQPNPAELEPVSSLFRRFVFSHGPKADRIRTGPVRSRETNRGGSRGSLHKHFFFFFFFLQKKRVEQHGSRWRSSKRVQL